MKTCSATASRLFPTIHLCMGVGLFNGLPCPYCEPVSPRDDANSAVRNCAENSISDH